MAKKLDVKKLKVFGSSKLKVDADTGVFTGLGLPVSTRKPGASRTFQYSPPLGTPLDITYASPVLVRSVSKPKKVKRSPKRVIDAVDSLPSKPDLAWSRQPKVLEKFNKFLAKSAHINLKIEHIKDNFAKGRISAAERNQAVQYELRNLAELKAQTRLPPSMLKGLQEQRKGREVDVEEKKVAAADWYNRQSLKLQTHALDLDLLHGLRSQLAAEEAMWRSAMAPMRDKDTKEYDKLKAAEVRKEKLAAFRKAMEEHTQLEKDFWQRGLDRTKAAALQAKITKLSASKKKHKPLFSFLKPKKKRSKHTLKKRKSSPRSSRAQMNVYVNTELERLNRDKKPDSYHHKLSTSKKVTPRGKGWWQEPVPHSTAASKGHLKRHSRKLRRIRRN